eukprot:TRINITY_DN17733_c0_g1_i1.p1 TRINITY_DN17733_c0_g1~~TRINITY_DN17733_c0_g1_i1.p1  ORF type:complete len:357 (-),score=110.81 TRINITY_DN17733_c0_g1_i1:56-1093(-)
MEERLEPLASTLESIVESPTLKWVFVGGKGGVGKTTVSCCLSILVARYVKEHGRNGKPGKVLLISTDPAHNVSDAFGQKFTKAPTPVNGFDNLHAMEIDPSLDNVEDLLGGPMGGLGDMVGLTNLASAIPGIDEAMSVAEVMRQVHSMEYTVVLFDTAPTGHTLRFLSFPGTLQKSMGKIMELKNKFSPLLSQVGKMFGQEMGDTAGFESKLAETKGIIEEVSTQFKNPELTTFVPVMIPEFLSVYETERLIQELMRFEMDVTSIVVNQLICPCKENTCTMCTARCSMQQKYVSQIHNLYEDFHVVLLPLLTHEVRGVPELTEFGVNLVQPNAEAHAIFDKPAAK